MEAGSTTYARLLRRFIQQRVIDPDDTIFVQFAGQYDQEICKEVGLTSCTFGNIAPDSASSGLADARTFDAHRMPYPSGSFDHVLGHAGLHHCSRPHEALHEMYRMARRVVLFVENQDSVLMRLAARAGFVAFYEHAAVRDGSGTSGGVDGTGVPNYVYRWTRREVEKAVKSFEPGMHVPINFHAEWNLISGRASSRLLRTKLRLRSDKTAERLINAAQSSLNFVAHSQGNIFAASIRKDLAVPQPWATLDQTEQGDASITVSPVELLE